MVAHKQHVIGIFGMNTYVQKSLLVVGLVVITFWLVSSPALFC